MANFPCERDVKSKTLELMKNGRLEALELVALFLLKTEFFVDNIICLVKIGFEKIGTNTK